MIKTTIAVLLSGLLLAACSNKEREQQLETREQALLEKEKAFALKETEYTALLQLRDSLIAAQKADTAVNETVVVSWPPTLAGTWNSSLVCTESNCSDYIIGDRRTDTWELSTDSTQLVAKVTSNNKLVRVYRATYADNIIKLHFKTDSASAKQVDMNVLLDDIGSNKIRGSRTVSVDNKCLAKFSVELTRIPK